MFAGKNVRCRRWMVGAVILVVASVTGLGSQPAVAANPGQAAGSLGGRCTGVLEHCFRGGDSRRGGWRESVVPRQPRPAWHARRGRLCRRATRGFRRPSGVSTHCRLPCELAGQGKSARGSDRRALW